MATLPTVSIGEIAAGTSGYGLLPAITIDETSAATVGLGLLPAITIDGSPGATITADVPVLALTYAFDVPALPENVQRPDPLALTYVLNVPALVRVTHNPSALGITYVLQAPTYRWAFSPNIQISTVYRCTLGDLELPISSFQARLRDATPTYLGVIVPNSPDWIDEVTARSADSLTVERGAVLQDGTTVWATIVTVPLDSMRYDNGPHSSSMTLSGHVTQTNTQPRTIPITRVISESLLESGQHKLRVGYVDFQLRPGDTIEYGATSWTAGLISIAVGANQQSMDITEAD